MSDSNNYSIRIVLIDKHVLLRAGMRLLLEKHQGIKVVGEAGNLNDGLKSLAEQKPDIILFRINLNKRSYTDNIPIIRNASYQARLILITEGNDPQILQQVIEDGVAGIVSPTQEPEILLKAIDKVIEGEVWLERSIFADALLRLTRNQHNLDANPKEKNIAQLSKRERKVVLLIGRGYKNKTIASLLGITDITVRHHLTSIYSKLGVSDRLELLLYINRYGLV
jgi:two-component system nitrate/nitrite response regulator NarL